MKQWAIEDDLPAHASTVTCVAIGRKSGRVMVTGGDDRRVNVWAVGKPQAIMSLTGHTSPIESVTLDWPEEIAVAGAANGTIKLWDLDHSKVIRTLTGHKPSQPTTTLEFHPFGEFFASGSGDGTCKIWDVRRKGCIQTYNAEENVVVVKISPDGRWIAVGGDRGAVKIWDMTAGRLLQKFHDHTAAVTSMAFNPSEFSMATLGMDKMLRGYDLTTFEGIGAGSVKGRPGVVEFRSEGSGVVVATSAGVMTWSFEPTLLLDTVVIPWDASATANPSPRPSSASISSASSPIRGSAIGSMPQPSLPNASPVADLKLVHGENRLVAATLRQNNVTIWDVDLSRVAPIDGLASATYTAGADGGDEEDIVARSFTLRADPGERKSAESPLEPILRMPKGGDDPDNLDGDGTRYLSAHHSPDSLLPAHPTHTASPPLDDLDLEPAEPVPPLSIENDQISSAPPTSAPADTSSCAPKLSSARGFNDGVPTVSLTTGPQNTLSTKHLARNRSVIDEPAMAPSGSAGSDALKRPASLRKEQTIGGEEGQGSIGDPLPYSSRVEQVPLEFDEANARTQTFTSESDLLDALRSRHHSVLATLTNRLASLRLIAQQWDTSNYGPAVETAVRVADVAIWSDLQVAIVANPKGLTLDSCLNVLPAIIQALVDPGDEFADAACETTKILARHFALVVRSNLDVSVQNSPGVDLNREKRIEKCARCFHLFNEVAGALSERIEKGLGGFKEQETLKDLKEYFQ
ncbi:Katanin p80 WD40 repeat-containing subunit B1 [Gonapodya sp. JEL0774]|nr:Katanin p80 WD40 repeat-containing subunit B1 [Gonapodya sp. JEL0774]